MAISITPLHPHIGAEIGGLDLANPIDEAQVQEMWRAIGPLVKAPPSA